jgi:hypothetical protein
LFAAARLLALDQAAEARRQAELVPAALRGTSWSIVAAWAAQRAGDPVEAARLLAAVDPEVLRRLRVSGDEEVARLIAHAGARLAP